jgi:MFS family permease
MRRLFWLVAAVVLVDNMFFAAVAPLLPHYADELELTKTGAAILTAAHPAGTLLGALPGGWLAIRWGVKPTLLVGLAIFGVCSTIFGFAQNIVLLDLARFVLGIAGAWIWAAAMGWLVSAAPSESRGRWIGMAMSAAVLGVLLGPVLGGLATLLSPQAVFSAVGASAAFLALWTWRTPGVEQKPSRGPLAMLRSLRRPAMLLGFWLYTIPALFAGVIEVLVPLRMNELGATGAAIGVAFLLSAVLEAVLSPAAGRAADRFGRLAPVRVGLVASGLMALVMTLPQTAFLVAAGLVAIIAAMAVLWAPAAAQLSDASEEAGLDMALAFSISNIAWAIGLMVGAAGGGSLAAATSDAVPYVGLALCAAVTLAMVSKVQRMAAAPAS